MADIVWITLGMLILAGIGVVVALTLRRMWLTRQEREEPPLRPIVADTELEELAALEALRKERTQEAQDVLAIEDPRERSKALTALLRRRRAQRGE